MYDERIDMGLTTTYWCDACEKHIDQRELIKVTIEKKHLTPRALWVCEDCLSEGFVFGGNPGYEKLT